MNRDFMTRTRNIITGGELELPTNILSVPYCIFHFIRSICVGQAHAAVESFRAVTHAIKSAPQKCSNMVNKAKEAFSRWATTEEGHVEMTDLAAFGSFYLIVMSELDKNKSTYQDFGENPHVLRCEANIARFHPDETLITAVRVDFQTASEILELHNRGETEEILRLSRSLLSQLVDVDDGNSAHELSSQIAVPASSPSPPGGRQRLLNLDLETIPNNAEVSDTIQGSGGEFLEFTSHVNPYYASSISGNSPAAIDRQSFFTTNKKAKPNEGRGPNIGGATRNKRATKKYKSKTYKSKKNKRQSRRKVRRSSSRKSRK